MIDPPTLPPFLSMLMNVPGVTDIVIAKLPIARKSGKRRSVFDSRETMFKRYSEKRLFKAFDPDILRDYIKGGTRDHAEGVELTCPPWFEARIFGSHSHNLYRAARYLPKYSKVFQLAGVDSTTAKTRARMRCFAGEDIVTYSSAELPHLFPMEQPELATNLLREQLHRSRLILSDNRVKI